MLHLIFTAAVKIDGEMKITVKVIIFLSAAFLLMAAENFVKEYAALSGLLAVVSMACVVKIRSGKSASVKLSERFGDLWTAAEVLLFVLVGAAVDIRYTLAAGISAVGMIFLALVFRAAGVVICMIGTELSLKERFFCVVAYLPKATVQAAIGAVPLSLGLPCGKIVLSVAVLAIIITAPLGALGIDIFSKRILEVAEQN